MEKGVLLLALKVQKEGLPSVGGAAGAYRDGVPGVGQEVREICGVIGYWSAACHQHACGHGGRGH